VSDNSPTWNGDVTLSTTAVVVRIDGSTNTLTLNGRIGGVGNGLTKLGSGTLVFAGSGANDYTGTTIVIDGHLRLVKTTEISAINAVTGPLVIGENCSGACSFGAVQLFANNQIDNTSAVTVNNTGLLLLHGFNDTIGSVAGTGTLSLDGGTLTVGANNNSTTFSGPIGDFNGPAGGGLTKVGTGTLTLGGIESNSYTGTTTVNNGILELAKPAGVNAFNGPLVIGDGLGSLSSDQVQLSANDQIPAGSAVTVNVTGRLNLNGRSDTIGALTVNGGLVDTGAGTLTLGANVTATSVNFAGQNNPATINGNLALGGAQRTFTVTDGPGDTDLSVAAVVSGAAGVGLIKSGPGKMVLTGANTYTYTYTYTGNTIVSGGILQVDGAQGTSTTFVETGGTLAGTGTVGPLTVAGGATLGLGSGDSLTVRGNASFQNPLATFAAHPFLNSIGRLSATGTVALNNATLRVFDFPLFLPQRDLPIPIVSAGILTGMFNGLPNGAIVVSSTGSGSSYRVNASGTTSVTLTRVNGPAFQNRAITSPIDEGSVARLTGHITTILPDDTFFLDVNWGDSSPAQTFRFGPNASRDVVLEHRYLDEGTYTVGLLWRDQRGAFNTGTLAVTVRNVAPTVHAGGDAVVALGRHVCAWRLLHGSRRGHLDGDRQLRRRRRRAAPRTQPGPAIHAAAPLPGPRHLHRDGYGPRRRRRGRHG
jgi:autotransporter-associated beta strand protein